MRRTVKNSHNAQHPSLISGISQTQGNTGVIHPSRTGIFSSGRCKTVRNTRN